MSGREGGEKEEIRLTRMLLYLGHAKQLRMKCPNCPQCNHSPAPCASIAQQGRDVLIGAALGPRRKWNSHEKLERQITPGEKRHLISLVNFY